jgi:hypothetical protein
MIPLSGAGKTPLIGVPPVGILAGTLAGTLVLWLAARMIVPPALARVP